MNNNYNSMCIPIKANTYWQYYGANAGGNQWDSPVCIYWFPMGGSSSTVETTYRIVKDSKMVKVSPLPSPAVNMQEIRDKKEANAHDFILKLEKAFDKELKKEIRKELASSLLEF